MDSFSQLKQFFDYDYWATSKVLKVIGQAPSFEKKKKAVGLLAHMLVAQQFWHHRIVGKDDSRLELWPETPSLGDCRKLLERMNKKIKALLEDNKDDLGRTIHYRNSKGTPYENRLSDILHHLIIHGQHHRAQIATLMRQSDIDPPGTDFIFYIREQQN